MQLSLALWEPSFGALTWLAEDPLPIWLTGAALFTVALVVYLQLRSSWALIGMLAVAALVGLLTLIEHFVITPGEQVEQALRDIVAAVEADDLSTVLTLMSSRATEAKTDAETLMPRLTIAKARVTNKPEIVFSSSGEATAKFRGLIDVTDQKSAIKGVYYDDIEVRFACEGEQWLLLDYTPTQAWRKRMGRTPGS